MNQNVCLIVFSLLFDNSQICRQGRSQDFSKGGAEAMEAKALKRKNCL